MKPILTLAATTLLGTFLSQPSLAQQQHADNSQHTAQQNSLPASQIPLLPASDIAGRRVLDQSGNAVGRIDSIIVDSRNGGVEYVLIGDQGNGDLNGQLVAVPWSVLQEPNPHGPIQLKITAAQLDEAPKFNSVNDKRLRDSRWRTRIYGYYGYSYPFYNASNAAAGSESSQAQNQGNGEAPGERSNALAVNENGTVSALGFANSVSAASLQSSPVWARRGNEIGHIDQVLIDTRNGKVAYVLIERGGFLGLSPTWYAIPVEVLTWSPATGNGYAGRGVGAGYYGPAYGYNRGGYYGNGYYGNRNEGNGEGNSGYRLTVNENLLRGLPTIPVNHANLITQTSKSDLSELYRHFGIQPYWQRTMAQNNGLSPTQ